MAHRTDFVSTRYHDKGVCHMYGLWLGWTISFRYAIHSTLLSLWHSSNLAQVRK